MTLTGNVSIPAYLWAVIGTVAAAMLTGFVAMGVWIVMSIYSLQLDVALLKADMMRDGQSQARVEAKVDGVVAVVGQLQRDFDRTFGKGGP
jgi:hypothetical protein